MLTQFVLALFLSAIIAGLAYWRGSLSLSGAGAAMVVGILIFGFGGWQWGILLVLFFTSSSLLSHYREDDKQAVAEEKFDKGHRRDAAQVLANGGVGAVAAVLHTAVPSPLWFPLFVGALASVTADTWATELGTLSRQPPRLITNGRPVPVGTSGGISVWGTAVSFGGGLVIGLAAGLLTGHDIFPLTIIGGLAGLAGSMSDSLLGATVQQIFLCPVCGKETEKKWHCGQPANHRRGWNWMSNDWVNLVSSVVGGLTAVLLSLMISH